METDEERLLSEAGRVDGFLSAPEALLLFRLAKTIRPGGTVVEIGSYKGKSTVCLGTGLKGSAGSRIYAVDHHGGSPEHRASGTEVNTFQEFRDSIGRNGLTELVVPVIKTSAEAVQGWSKPISLVFIDGAHEEKAVAHDFESWVPHVEEGGWVVMHDTTGTLKQGLLGWRGPRRIANRRIFRSEHFADVVVCDTITAARKVRKRGPGQSARAIALLLLRKAPTDALSRAIWRFLELPDGPRRMIGGIARSTIRIFVRGPSRDAY